MPVAVSSRLPPLFALCAAAGWWVFNWPALVGLHKRWWTFGETYEIGYPLLLIALYSIATQWPRLRTLPIAPSWLGCALFLLALLASCAARLAQLLVIQQLMVPVSLWCGLLAVLGWRLALPLLLPCALLLGGVPIWDFLVDPLRIVTVWVSEFLLRLIRIPSFVEGYSIVLPSGVLLVAEACSGLNLLLAALVLSVLQAALGLRSPWRRVLLVAAGAAIGIVDNWIRVFILIVIAHYSDMRNPLVNDHIGFGWGLFAVSLIPLFLIARALERGETGVTRQSTLAPAPASAPAGSVFAAAFLVLAAFGLSAYTARLERHTVSAVQQFAPPAGALPASNGWLPQYSGYDLAQTWRLPGAQRVYDLAVLLYREQRHGKKLIYYANHIADPATVRATARTTLASGQVVNRTVIGGSAPRAVWWYYRVDNTATASAPQAKWLQFRASLKGDSSAALVTLSVQCRDRDCAGDVLQTESGGAMLQDLDPSLRALPAAPPG